MDFIRNQKHKKDYNPNTRHCLFGQDGDLIMLGLATHEPHFSLLREEVIFDQSRKKSNLLMAKAAKEKLLKEEAAALEAAGGVDLDKNQDIKVSSESVSASIDSYIHNSNFELLHMSVLRDYLAYEFETNDVIPTSPFELEPTIDDFVFMTFFVGNDFLPHMPAIGEL
jgi:5'-3' exoribonuclease 2